MTVFKNYFKIIKPLIPSVITFTVVFILISVLATTGLEKNSTFKETKPKVTIINNDDSSVLLNHFIKYIEKNSDVNEIKEKDIKDALFFRKTNFVITIPQNYIRDFKLGLNPKLETQKSPDSEAVYTEMLLNNYLKTANMYLTAGYTEDEIVGNIDKDLKKETNLVLKNKSKAHSLERMKYYFNFSNYTFIALSILVVSMVMKIFNDTNLKRRNKISSYSFKRINREVLLGNVISMTALWLLYIIIGAILFSDAMFSINGLLLTINSLIFMMCASSFAFLVGTVIKSKEAISAVSNVFGLATSFMCGAFVPQELLGSVVISISKIFPSYWYISNNDLITGMTNFSVSNITPLLINIIVMFVFIVFILLIIKIYNKVKTKE